MNPKHHLLTVRIVLLVLAVVVSAAAIVAWLYGWDQREQSVLRYQQQIAAHQRTVVSGFTTAIEALRRDALFLSRTPPTQGIARARANGGVDPVDGTMEPQWRDRLTMIFRSFAEDRPEYYQISYIGVADEGLELVRVDSNAGEIRTISREELQAKGDRDYFRAALGLMPGEVALSAIDLNREHGRIEVPHRPVLRASTPVYAPWGELFGVVVLNVDLRQVLVHFESIQTDGIQTYLADESGRYLVHPEPGIAFGFEFGRTERMWTDFPVTARLFKEESAREGNLRIQMKQDGTQLMVERLHFDPADPARFVLLINALPEALVDANLASKRERVFAGIAAAALLVVLAVFLIMQRMLAPLRGLVAAADRISEGRYDVTLPTRAEGEIGSLSDAFRHMARRLEMREAELEAMTEELERRVEQRTAELSESEARLREREGSLNEAQRIANLGSWDWDLSAGTLWWSDQTYRIFGLAPQETPATYETFLARIHPDDRDLVTQAINGALAGNAPYRVEHRIVRPDREERIVLEQGEVVFGDDGKPQYMRGTVHDITERKEAERRLRLLSNVFEYSLEGILVTDAELRIIDVNNTFTEITGYRREEAIGQTPKLLSSGWHDKSHYENMWQSLMKQGRWQGEMWDRRKDGEVYVVWLSITAVCDPESRVTNYIGVSYDITNQKKSEETIRDLAYFDSLTGLPNRRLFDDRLEQSLLRGQRGGRPFTVMFLDLDRFKPINDSLGHKAGDLMLREVACRLSGIIRESDTAARFGGDEFALLIEDVDEFQSAAIARKIIDMIATPFHILDHEVFVGCSIGICLWPSDGDDAETLIEHADLAMYRAKHEGRNNFQFFSPEMTDGTSERLLLETALRHALERDELDLYYQPQVCIETGRITGAEALLRWRHPEWGFVSPAKFIPIAEETALIEIIGHWVLKRACWQANAWRDHLPEGFRIGVNLSPRQIRSKFAEYIREEIETCGGDPRLLELELTEGAVMRDPDAAITIMNELAALGFQIAIDDFGTGYSSLSYLKRLPIDKLKIDRSFIKDIPENVNDMAIAAATIAMARGLGIKVIAEGVETQDQHEFLRGQGCYEYQGYLCSQAVPPDEFIALLRKMNADDDGAA